MDACAIVRALLCGAADVEEAREQQAMARREDDRRTPRQAADAARRRPLSAAAEDAYLRMPIYGFPQMRTGSHK